MFGTEQSMISMKVEAKRMNGLMRVQKMSLTKLVNKCLQLMDTFKKEKGRESSPLVSQCASEVMKFHERTTDLMDIFREIHLTLHPPTQREATTRQPQVPIQVSVSFKPCMDLKPSILQRDCTLKEVERFIENFSNYMRLGYNSVIPAGLCQCRW